MTGNYWRDWGACISRNPKRVNEVFFIVWIRFKGEAQDGVLEGIVGIMVDGLPAIDSAIRGSRDRDEPYCNTQDSQEVGIAHTSKNYSQ